MQSHWLTLEERRSCILFFAGWGMDPEPFRPLAPDSHDLLMFYDYRIMDRPALTDLFKKYQELHLLAWSMGVWVAGRLLEEEQNRFATATAVNGTLTPVDDRCGIGKKTFAAMIDTFGDDSPDLFYESMFDTPEDAALFLRNRPRRAAGEMREELVALRDGYRDNGAASDIYTRRLVGSRDRIFPARSQIRCWGRDQCTLVQIPHFPFYGQHGLDGLILNREYV